MLHSRLHGSTEPVPPRSILLVRKRPVEITCVVNEADHSLRFGVEVCTAPPNIPQTFLDSAKLYELSSAEDESKYEFEVTPEEWARTVAPLLRPASLLCDDALRLAVSNTPLTPEFLQTFEVIRVDGPVRYGRKYMFFDLLLGY